MEILGKTLAYNPYCFVNKLPKWAGRASLLYITSLLFHMLEQQRLCELKTDWILSVPSVCYICSFNRTCSQKLKI